jgi:hypothetical protein
MNKYLKTATIIAELLDNKFNFLGIKFGLDPILGLIPGLGDLIGLIFSFYIVWVGIKMKVPTEKLVRMVVNVLMDFGVGLIPVLGDVADTVFKSNLINLEILKQHSENEIIDGEIVE